MLPEFVKSPNVVVTLVVPLEATFPLLLNDPAVRSALAAEVALVLGSMPIVPVLLKSPLTVADTAPFAALKLPVLVK